jgi:hypothetical protein
LIDDQIGLGKRLEDVQLVYDEVRWMITQTFVPLDIVLEPVRPIALNKTPMRMAAKKCDLMPSRLPSPSMAKIQIQAHDAKY